MLVCVEGLDGVGKTTVAKKLSSVLPMRFVEKPVKELFCISEECDKEIKNKLYYKYSKKMVALYYLMGYLSVKEDSKKENILLDRGFMSTYYFSFDSETQNIFDALGKDFEFPDLTFILYASIEERVKRIKSRNPSDLDLKKERIYSDGYDKLFSAIERYNIPYIIINTELLSFDEVVSICKMIIQFIIDGKDIIKIKEIFSINNLDVLGNMGFLKLCEIINQISSKKNCKTKIKM